MNLGPHAGFIVAAYAIAIAVIAILAIWIVADHRTLRRALSELELSSGDRRDNKKYGR